MKICYVTHASNLTGANNSMLNLICELRKNEKDIYPFNFINIKSTIKILSQVVIAISIYIILNYNYINKTINLKKLLKRKK